MSLLGALSELGCQGRFSGASFASDKADLAVSREGRIEETLQTCQLSFARYKHPPGHRHTSVSLLTGGVSLAGLCTLLPPSVQRP
jgi:hypothetical protein